MSDIATSTVGISEYNEWRAANFEETLMKVADWILEKGKKHGPFYRAHSSPQFQPTNTVIPHDDRESQHWVGTTRPGSPEEAIELYALPNSNTAEFLFEIYIKPIDEKSFAFVGVPRDNSSGRVGSTLAINLNNSAISSQNLSYKRIEYEGINCVPKGVNTLIK